DDPHRASADVDPTGDEHGRRDHREGLQGRQRQAFREQARPCEEITMPATATKNGVKMKTLKLLIDGQWVVSARGTTRHIVDPATEEVIADAYDASPLEVGQAVAAARKAFDSGVWSDKSPAERAGVILKWA